MAPDTLVIRDASVDDLPALADLLGSFFDSHASALPGVFARAGEAERVETARSLLDEPSRAFVATLHDEVVGVLTLEEIRPDKPRVGRQLEHHAMIHLVAISPSHQRQGIGARLMQHGTDWAREHGFPELRIHVWEFNLAARELYEAAGYRTLSRIMAREVPAGSGDAR